MSYYTGIMICTWVSLAVLCVLVRENDRLPLKDKTTYYLTYALIGLSALTEWIGVMISGNAEISSNLLRFIKCCDYILTPMAGFAFVMQMRMRNKIDRVMSWLIAVNTVFQVISVFTGWMTVISPDNSYSHGSLYNVYMIIYLIIIVLVVVQFAIYGKTYRKQNRASLYLILLLTILGVALQEVVDGEIRTSYIALALGAAFMYIHTTEFSQQKTDERIEEQKILISRDALTGLLSRYAYSHALEQYDSEMPEDAAVFSIDINGLKEVNDNLGHDAGDELIIGAASCIKKVFDGHAFRTGGDEFIVLCRMNKTQAKRAVDELSRCTKEWQGETVKEIHLAIGYALIADNPGASCEELVKLADKQMYSAKGAYYRESGKDRRKR